MTIRAAAAVTVVLAATAGCSGGNGGSERSDRAVATFEVANGERFKVELVTHELIDHARKLLDGEKVSAIPLGRVVRGDPGVNAPWSWHLAPETFSFAFATVEVCDGIPSDVENRTITSDDYCPWSAKLVDLQVGDTPSAS